MLKCLFKEKNNNNKLLFFLNREESVEVKDERSDKSDGRPKDRDAPVSEKPRDRKGDRHTSRDDMSDRRDSRQDKPERHESRDSRDSR